MGGLLLLLVHRMIGGGSRCSRLCRRSLLLCKCLHMLLRPIPHRVSNRLSHRSSQCRDFPCDLVDRKILLEVARQCRRVTQRTRGFEGQAAADAQGAKTVETGQTHRNLEGILSGGGTETRQHRNEQTTMEETRQTHSTSGNRAHERTGGKIGRGGARTGATHTRRERGRATQLSRRSKQPRC